MLFPAHAGVFPPPVRPRSADHALPRARGGISGSSMAIYTHNLFPAHAGVFPIENDPRTQPHTLPRARGGISVAADFDRLNFRSSPRTRGYFRGVRPLYYLKRLFPAHAGVFPESHTRPAMPVTLPRARGGISAALAAPITTPASSPRTRGYFQAAYGVKETVELFPAHAGVFPAVAFRRLIRCALPRARGGISRSASA